MKSETGLVCLLADLFRDPALRSRLAQDPDSVLGEYDVDSSHRALLKAGSAHQVHRLVRDGLDELLEGSRTEVHAMSPWLTKTPALTDISPQTAPINGSTEFRAVGQFFAPDATLTFSRPGATVKATEVSVSTDPNGNSSLSGKACFEVLGAYDVAVTNVAAGESGRLPQAFTASEG